MSSIPAYVDPFTFVAQGIVQALNAWSGFTNLVKPANVIDMTMAQFQSSGFKQNVKSSDLPELIVMEDEMKTVRRNSQILEINQSYKFVMTQDGLGSTKMNMVHWQILVALQQAGDELGMTAIDGLCGHFIRTWTPAIGKMDAVGNTAELAQWKREAQRWVSAMSITVNMYFSGVMMNQLTQ